MPFDFRYDERTDYISKEGYYSMCEPHEATREEALLWRRVQELERLLDEACPEDTQALLSLLAVIPDGVTEVEMNAIDFASLRRYARHRVEIVTHPQSNRRGIMGSLAIMVDGSPSSVWVAVKRDVPRGSLRMVNQSGISSSADGASRSSV